MAPADIPKDSTSFDAPTAVSILLAAETVAQKPNDQTLLFGELGLDGQEYARKGATLYSAPPLINLEEILEVTHLHSLASKDYEKIITARPFRAPHHSANRSKIDSFQ